MDEPRSLRHWDWRTMKLEKASTTRYDGNKRKAAIVVEQLWYAYYAIIIIALQKETSGVSSQLNRLLERDPLDALV